MIVLLDENNYFTGSYAEIDGIEGGTEVETLPDTDDILKQQAYRYETVLQESNPAESTDSIEKIRSDVDYAAVVSGVELE